MPRGDGLSPHKNLRRSTRDHARLYTSLEENNLEMHDDDFEPPSRSSRRNRDRRERESQRNESYTRFGRKINHNRYYDDFDPYSAEDDARARAEPTLTYRQQILVAINDSKRIQKDRDRNSDGDRKSIDEVATSSRRKRVTIDEEDIEDDINTKNHKPENLPEDDEPVIRRSTRRNPSLQPRSSVEPDDKEESPIRRSSRRGRRLDSDEKVELLNQDTVDVEMEENGGDGEDKDDENVKNEDVDDEEEDENEKEEEESSTSEEEEEEYQKPRQYSLRQRRPAVVKFEQEQAQAREMRNRRAIVRSEGREDGGSSRRRNMGRHHRSRPGNRRMRSDSDSSDDGRFNRSDRKHHLDRSRFMPINMTEKEISSVEHIVQERVRKTGGGQGSSDIDPMAIDESVGFDQVGGLAGHIQSLKEVVLFPMLYPEIFAKFNINPPKGVVFYGPPGTGKTLVARALANECRKGASKVAFFMRKGADCLSKWVGESERQLRLLFDQAYAMRPSIIFFDEIDGLAPVRSSKQDQIHASIVSTLLALMDGLDSRGEVVVIGATNRLDTLDPALRRPGRFDRELRFSLPDLTARKQILDIHTSKWDENKPDEDTIKTIAEKTSGYCGADLKFLCTESVLIALRARYPHIYMCSERLKLDVGTIRVNKEHFSHAMRRITPASRRDLTIPSRPLDERTNILLGEIVENLISIRIPHGYRCVESPASTADTELEKVVRALEPHPTVPSIRLLICGSNAVSDGGQTSYVMPAILSKLDHLPVFSLSVSSLLNDGRAEEAFSHAVQAAMRASTTGPCIMLLPSIDEWIKVVPVSVQHMLITCLESMTGFTPILFLASLDSSFDDAPEYVKEVFRHANCAAMPPARRVLREKYFEYIFEPVFRPPKIFDASQYVKPEVETAVNAPAAKRKLSEAEARELEKMYLSLLRQMRIFLRDRLNRFIRDRRFVDFVMPVDKEDAEDYYEIIETPMCLTDMMEKLDNKKYIHADQFLDDVRLITLNALEYNPAMTQDGRTIRNMAIGLRDVAEELFDSELDENFVNNLETTSRLMQEAGIFPEDEILIEIPSGFTRKAPWSIKNSLKSEIEKWKRDREKEAKKNGTFVDEVKNEENATTSSDTIPAVKTTTKRKRSKSYNFPGMKKRKIARTTNHVDEDGHSDGEETEDDMTNEDDEIENNTPERATDGEVVVNGAVKDQVDFSQSQSNSIDDVLPEEKKGELVISKPDILELIGFCIEKSEGWSVSELERLASVMSHKIEQYRTKWNRSALPEDLTSIVQNWQSHENIDDSMSNSPPVKNGIVLNGHK